MPEGKYQVYEYEKVSQGKEVKERTLADIPTNKDTLLLIHGFNSEFRDVTNAFLEFEKRVHAAGFQGNIIGFTWPSYGEWYMFFGDKEQVEYAIVALLNFLLEFRPRLGQNNLHINAHSMGAYLLIGTLARYSQKVSLPEGDFIDQITFFGADVSNDILAKGKDGYRAIRKANRLTFYFNKRDPVLGASAFANQDDRLGLNGAEQADRLPDNAFQVDCSTLIETHTGYLKNAQVMRDLVAVLHRTPSAEIAGRRMTSEKNTFRIAPEPTERKPVVPKAEDAGTYNWVGREALIQQRHKDAEQAFRKAIELAPKEPTYHFNLGLALQNLKRYPEAEEEYRLAFGINEEYHVARNALGRLLLQQKRYDEAEKSYRYVLSKDENNVDVLTGLGELHLELSEELGEEDFLHEAINFVNRALTSAPKKTYANIELASVYFLRGYIRAKLRDYRGAKEDFNRCLQRDPHHFKAKRNIGRVKKIVEDERPEKLLKWGGWVLSLVSLGVFGLSHVLFFYRFNEFTPGYYALFLFGSLVLVVAGICLPQMTKLKVGAVELEKGSASQAMTRPIVKLER